MNRIFSRAFHLSKLPRRKRNQSDMFERDLSSLVTARLSIVSYSARRNESLEEKEGGEILVIGESNYRMKILSNFDHLD